MKIMINALNRKLNIFLIVIFAISIVVPFTVSADYYDGDYSYSGYNYDVPSYGYGGYNYSTPDYSYSGYNYDVPDYSYSGYNYDVPDYSYSGYNYDVPDYSYSGYNYDYPDYSYSGYNYDYEDYADYGYDDNYSYYGNYSTPSYVTYNYGYTCSSSGCTGSQNQSQSQTQSVVVRNTNLNNNNNEVVIIDRGNNSGGGNNGGGNNTETLRVICEVSDTSVEEGDYVTFTANVTGGRSPYTYDWNGDVDSTGRSVQVRFNNSGTYDASITVRDSNGRTASDDCLTVRVSDDDDDNNDRDLDVICEVSDTSVEEGDYVTFTARVSGGNSPFRYDWNGDVDSTGRSVQVRFDDNGTYRASITVRDDDGDTATDTCDTVRVSDDDDDNNDNDDLNVQCKVSDYSADDGDYVTVSVDINDGRSPYNITWSGDTRDFRSFDRNDESQRVRIDTNSDRIELEVKVRDRSGNEDSDDCVIRIGNYSSGGSNYRNNNDGELSGLSSVFLSQVPYTGSEDILKTLGFIAGLLIWSAIVGVVLLRKKNRKELSSKAQAFKEANRLQKVSN